MSNVNEVVLSFNNTNFVHVCNRDFVSTNFDKYTVCYSWSVNNLNNFFSNVFNLFFLCVYFQHVKDFLINVVNSFNKEVVFTFNDINVCYSSVLFVYNSFNVFSIFFENDCYFLPNVMNHFVK